MWNFVFKIKDHIIFHIFFNELIQVYPIYWKNLAIFHKKMSFWVIFWKSHFWDIKFYGAFVERIVEYLYLYVYVYLYSLLIIFSCLIAHTFYLMWQTWPLVQDFCHSPRCPSYKSATLKMSEFRLLWRSWQYKPKFFFFTMTQIKSLYKFCL